MRRVTSVKRTLLILVIGALTTLGAVIFRRDPAVERASFQPRLRDALKSNGFTTIAEATCGADQVSLPLLVEWHPRHWGTKRSTQTGIGFPDAAERYTIAQHGGSALDCFVRYVDDRASIIQIRASRGEEVVAGNLRSSLVREFPGLPIKSQIQQ